MCELSKTLTSSRSPFLGFGNRVQFPKANRPDPAIDRSPDDIRENFGSRTSPPPPHPFLQIRK